jgi:antigen flippase
MSANPAIGSYDDSKEVLSPELLSAVPARKQTYGQILKSSAIVGGSTVLNVGIGIVRTKIMALLLGPGGFGLAGLYASIINLTQSIAGMGLNSSGVRQIAEAASRGNRDGVARTAIALQQTSLVLGLLGAALLLMFPREISILTFGNAQHRGAVRLISSAVLFQLISAGQGALIQGMRRIADLAKMNVIGAFSGLIISVPIVYVMRERGIAISLVVVAATTIVTSWWYSRKIQINSVRLTLGEIRFETAGLLKLGIVFMVSGLLVPGVGYFVRVILLHRAGIVATGMYQSAWTIGGLYVGFILQAMGADFYPRLSAAANNNEECNRLVNEQALVGLLIAGPGVVATLTFAPLVISLLYSTKFGAAVGVLRWICLGSTLQLLTWPMGFIIVAKARRRLFLLSELLWAIAAMVLAWGCVNWWGLNGAGLAFFLSYIAHWLVVYPITRRLSGFRWSLQNRRTGVIVLSSIGAVFSSFYVLPLRVASSVGALAALLSGLYSIRALAKLIPKNEIPLPMRQLLVGLHLIPSGTIPANQPSGV